MRSRNKDFMETIFEVSIQPTAGYLVNCHLSNHEVSKLYCNHMKQKFCHLLFTLANFRGALELGSGRNPDFSEFRFLPELIKNHGQNRNFVLFREIEYQVYLLNSIGRNLDYTR
jgi:hypothetical protein